MMKKVIVILTLVLSSISSAALIEWSVEDGGNGHAYEFVNVKLSWFDARDAAATSTYMGEHGYLATITFQEEQDFLLDNFVTNVESWLGGSDAAQEGVWKWVVGPEAGQTFWIGGSVAVGGYPVDYANWRSNQPSNEGGVEDYLVWRQDEQMKWNDLSGNTLKTYFIEYPVPEPTVTVSLDIKPTSCPNPLNTKSQGVLPIAILGSEEFDVSTIVPTSVRLAGIEPIRDSLEDVSTLLTDPNECECTTNGPDGFTDLTLKFKTQDIVEALGEVNTGDILTLPLTGVLNDETPIEGADCVVIVGRHKPINKADVNEDGVVNMVDMFLIAENWLESSIVE